MIKGAKMGDDELLDYADEYLNTQLIELTQELNGSDLMSEDEIEISNNQE